MKSSEKIQLLLKGIKMDEIKALEDQEAAEAAEEQRKLEELDKEQESKEKTALEAALSMVKDLEEKLQSKEDELTKLNQDFANINNLQTVKEEPEKKYDGADVMKELFNPAKKEE